MRRWTRRSCTNTRACSSVRRWIGCGTRCAAPCFDAFKPRRRTWTEIRHRVLDRAPRRRNQSPAGPWRNRQVTATASPSTIAKLDDAPSNPPGFPFANIMRSDAGDHAPRRSLSVDSMIARSRQMFALHTGAPTRMSLNWPRRSSSTVRIASSRAVAQAGSRSSSSKRALFSATVGSLRAQGPEPDSSAIATASSLISSSADSQRAGGAGVEAGPGRVWRGASVGSRPRVVGRSGGRAAQRVPQAAAIRARA